MNRTLNYLETIGADINGIKERFMGDLDFYFDCLEEFFSTQDIEKLKAELKDEKTEAAFETAHSLKGVTGNLGLTKLFHLISNPVEMLRNSKMCGVKESIEEYEREFNKEKNLLLKD